MCSLNKRVHLIVRLINVFYIYIFVFHLNICVALVGHSRIALVADLEKGFLNIELDSGDRDFLRFLWVVNIHEDEVKPVEYRFYRVVFGVNCSPLLLNTTLQHHLDRFLKGNPKLIRKLKDSFYVDDLVTGEQTPEHALSLYEVASNNFPSG